MNDNKEDEVTLALDFLPGEQMHETSIILRDVRVYKEREDVPERGGQAILNGVKVKICTEEESYIKQLGDLKIENFTLKGEIFRAHSRLGKFGVIEPTCECESCKEYREAVFAAGMKVKESRNNQ